MTKDDFEDLSLLQRADLLWDRGEFVSSFKYYKQTLSLYILCGLYVELHYSDSENKIVQIEILKDKKRFNRYINEMVLNVEDFD